MSSNQENEHAKLGERLREARKVRKLSQKEASRLTGVSEYTIFHLERGEINADVLVLKKLAQGYKQPLSYFISDEIKSPKLHKMEHLLLRIAALSDRDREELAQFAEFLDSRAASPKS